MIDKPTISAEHQAIANKLASAFIDEETFPTDVVSFSEDDAFSIKRAMFRILKTTLPEKKPMVKIIGRKIGRNDNVGLIATPIYRQGERSSHPLPKNLIGLEPELAVVWGNELPARIKNEKDFYQALKDVGGQLVLGVEILANRFQVPPLPWHEKNRPDFSIILADHLHQWGFVVGDKIETIDVARHYHQESFAFHYGDKTIKAGSAKLAFGNPINMLWQFYQTRPFNPLTTTEQFNTGDIITLGSLFGSALPLTKGDVKPNDKVLFEFPGFEPLEIIWQ
ncbi:MAG: hypothetical protein ACR2NY_03650 [Alphaproteobacteria bacterium]